MELYRKIYSDLKKWKDTSNGNTALLIEGARRVGKSTIVERFANEEYQSYILIDFNKATKRIKDNFDNLNRLDIFFQTISLEYNTQLYNRKSLIVFDEIQKYPKAREAIKYLVADGRFDYIETGSLISIKENVKDITIPSEEESLRMYPLDFEEFMIAAGEELLLEYIKECWQSKTPLEQHYHVRAMNLFKEYMLVGGMPQSVVAYFENSRDFYTADIAKRNIINLYRNDIRKITKKYGSKVSALFDNIPGYLSTHEKKIVLKEAEGKAEYSYFEDPLFWLDDSMICNLCYKCNDPNVGFALNKNDSSVKCYMGDTGLLVSLAFSENEISSQQLYKSIMNDKLSLNKGMLFENVIAQMITAKNKKLYFYTRYNEDKHRNDMEIDFLLSNESKTAFKIIPIEVKSSKNYSTTSLDEFGKIYSKRISHSLIIHPKNFVYDKKIIKIPPYMFAIVFN